MLLACDDTSYVDLTTALRPSHGQAFDVETFMRFCNEAAQNERSGGGGGGGGGGGMSVSSLNRF